MPFNLLKTYNQLLDFLGMSEVQRTNSLLGVFRRDIETNTAFNFRGKKINPIHGKSPEMETLFTHLTGEIVDKKERRREYEKNRCERLHWIKNHTEERCPALQVFSVEDTDGERTYIYNEVEQYIVVLAPYRDRREYYLITAHYLDGRNPDKMKNKIKRKLDEVL